MQIVWGCLQTRAVKILQRRTGLVVPRLLVSGEQQIVWVFSRPTDVGKDSQHLEHYGCDKKYSDNDGINNKREIGIPQRFHERSTSAAIQIFMPVRFSTPTLVTARFRGDGFGRKF